MNPLKYGKGFDLEEFYAMKMVKKYKYNSF